MKKEELIKNLQQTGFIKIKQYSDYETWQGNPVFGIYGEDLNFIEIDIYSDHYEVEYFAASEDSEEFYRT